MAKKIAKNRVTKHSIIKVGLDSRKLQLCFDMRKKLIPSLCTQYNIHFVCVGVFCACTKATKRFKEADSLNKKLDSHDPTLTIGVYLGSISPSILVEIFSPGKTSRLQLFRLTQARFTCTRLKLMMQPYMYVHLCWPW